MNLEQAQQKLRACHQEHLLKYYDTLAPEAQADLLKQIEVTDFSVIERLGADKIASDRKITPIQAMTLKEIEENKASYTETGLKAIRAGKIGAVLLAGGMGTRLGSDAPKGMYNIGITKPVYIFERIIANLLAVTDLAQAQIPLFIMTSEKNHNDTVAFLKEHDFFGYDAAQVHFFTQDMAPTADYSGKILLEDKARIATSPNGNGGWFTSLQNAGLLDLIKKEGIEYLNVFAVDNVLQRIADPVFVGAVLEKDCEVGAKVVRKNAPDEKVGVMCLDNGHPSIIEYYELTDALRDTVNEAGEPAYNFGVILNYLFRVSSLERIVSRALPLHIVEKKIPYLDEDGVFHNPAQPNGYKFETLILDLIQMLDSCLPFEVEREKEFAPIKNKTGIDSVESAQALLQKNNIQL